jgi:hypothetical protein
VLHVRQCISESLEKDLFNILHFVDIHFYYMFLPAFLSGESIFLIEVKLANLLKRNLSSQNSN